MDDAAFAAIPINSSDPKYGPGFFKFTELDHGWSASAFGHVLYRVFQPKLAIDFGCGAGRTLAALRQHGVTCYGIDGSAACLPFVARHDPELAKSILVHDLAKPWRSITRYDLAVSIETLEHVPPEGADVAVDTICAAAPVAAISACPPTTRIIDDKEVRNPLHLNEQPFDYWIEKFAARGFARDWKAEARVRGEMELLYDLHEAGLVPVVPFWHIGSYFGVFRRSGT